VEKKRFVFEGDSRPNFIGDVNVLSKLSIIFKEWRVMNNVDREKPKVPVKDKILRRNKGNNKITELRTILQRESQNS
jgi:hypothetical protein